MYNSVVLNSFDNLHLSKYAVGYIYFKKLLRHKSLKTIKTDVPTHLEEKLVRYIDD